MRPSSPSIDHKALLIAACTGNLATIQNHGGQNIANLTVDDCTLLFAATEAGQSKVVEYFVSANNRKDPVIWGVQNCTLNWKNPKNRGFTAAHVAAQKGHHDCLCFLIEAGANLAIENDEIAYQNGTIIPAEYPLETALSNGHALSALYILNTMKNEYFYQKIKLSIFNRAVSKAVQYNNAALMKAFLEAGADIASPSKKDFITPLFEAAQHGFTQVVDFLLKQQGVLNYINTRCGASSATPLYQAVSNGHLACVRSLIQAGADLSIPNNSKVTPIMRALLNKHAAIAVVLVTDENNQQNLKKTINLPLLNPSEEKNLPRTWKELSALSIMSVAILQDFTYLLPALLKAGASLSKIMDNSLLLAASLKTEQFVLTALLLIAGVDPGDTSLEKIVCYKSQITKTIVDMATLLTDYHALSLLLLEKIGIPPTIQIDRINPNLNEAFFTARVFSRPKIDNPRSCVYKLHNLYKSLRLQRQTTSQHPLVEETPPQHQQAVAEESKASETTHREQQSPVTHFFQLQGGEAIPPQRNEGIKLEEFKH